MKLYGESSNATDLDISSIPNSISFFMFKVPAEKDYLKKFFIHNFEVTITEGAACMEIEAVKINYPAHVILRGGGTFIQKNFKSF